jgi:hypothetical protein
MTEYKITARRGSKAYQRQMILSTISLMVDNTESFFYNPPIFQMHFFNLIRYASSRNVTIKDLPELDNFLKKHKDYIILIFLYRIKDSDGGDHYYIDINNNIGYLHKMGIVWPELDIIEKSARAEIVKIVGLDETTKKDYWTNAFISEIKKNSIWGIAFYLRTRNYYSPNMSKIIPVLEEHKNNIIKEILSLIANTKGKKLLDIQTIVHYFFAIDINWPELKVIDRSLQAEIGKSINLNEDDEFRFSLHYIKATIVILLEEVLMQKGYSYANVRSKINQDTPFNDIIKLLEVYKDDILGIIEEGISGPIYYVPKILRKCDALLKFKCIWPELKTILETNKTHIIQYLLTSIKEYSTCSEIIFLDQFKLNWPELDIIKKSLTAEQSKNINESKTKEELKNMNYWVSVGHTFGDKIHTRGFAYDKLTPSNKELIDSYRQDIIKYILDNIYNGKSTYINSVYSTVLNFKKIGLPWPEIDIILKSLGTVEKLGK